MLGPSLLSILLVFGLLYGTVIFLQRSPASWIARLLLSDVGPTDDLAGGTRRALLRRARWFALAASVCFGTDLLLWYIGAHLTPFDPFSNPSVAALLFTFSLLCFTGVAGALYIGVRAWRLGEPPGVGGSDGETSKRLDA